MGLFIEDKKILGIECNGCGAKLYRSGRSFSELLELAIALGWRVSNGEAKPSGRSVRDYCERCLDCGRPAVMPDDRSPTVDPLTGFGPNDEG